MYFTYLFLPKVPYHTLSPPQTSFFFLFLFFFKNETRVRQARENSAGLLVLINVFFHVYIKWRVTWSLRRSPPSSMFLFKDECCCFFSIYIFRRFIIAVPFSVVCLVTVSVFCVSCVSLSLLYVRLYCQFASSFYDNFIFPLFYHPLLISSDSVKFFTDIPFPISLDHSYTFGTHF